METRLSRRSFLRAGITGGLALACAGGLYRLTRDPDAPHSFIFDSRAWEVLAAIVPAMLKGAIPPEAAAIDTAVERVQVAVAGLPLATQREIEDLFGLLALPPSRRFLVGLADDWAQAKSEDVAAFLQSWRIHRVGLLQSAYHALHDLILGSWYADESTWAAIGYPGPIKELS